MPPIGDLKVSSRNTSLINDDNQHTYVYEYVLEGSTSTTDQFVRIEGLVVPIRGISRILPEGD